MLSHELRKYQYLLYVASINAKKTRKKIKTLRRKGIIIISSISSSDFFYRFPCRFRQLALWQKKTHELIFVLDANHAYQ